MIATKCDTLGNSARQLLESLATGHNRKKPKLLALQDALFFASFLAVVPMTRSAPPARSFRNTGYDSVIGSACPQRLGRCESRDLIPSMLALVLLMARKATEPLSDELRRDIALHFC
jgi:hypothetical protein